GPQRQAPGRGVPRRGRGPAALAGERHDLGDGHPLAQAELSRAASPPRPPPGRSLLSSFAVASTVRSITRKHLEMRSVFDRKRAAALLAAVALPALTGCGSGDADAEESGP